MTSPVMTETIVTRRMALDVFNNHLILGDIPEIADVWLLCTWVQVHKSFGCSNDADLKRILLRYVTMVTRRFSGNPQDVTTPGYTVWCRGCILRMRETDLVPAEYNVSPQRYYGHCEDMKACTNKQLAGPGFLYKGIPVQFSTTEWKELVKLKEFQSVMTVLGFPMEAKARRPYKGWRRTAVASGSMLRDYMVSLWRHCGHLNSSKSNICISRGTQDPTGYLDASRPACSCLLRSTIRSLIPRAPFYAKKTWKSHPEVHFPVVNFSQGREYEKAVVIFSSHGAFATSGASRWVEWQGSAKRQKIGNVAMPLQM